MRKRLHTGSGKTSVTYLSELVLPVSLTTTTPLYPTPTTTLTLPPCNLRLLPLSKSLWPQPHSCSPNPGLWSTLSLHPLPLLSSFSSTAHTTLCIRSWLRKFVMKMSMKYTSSPSFLLSSLPTSLLLFIYSLPPPSLSLSLSLSLSSSSSSHIIYKYSSARERALLWCRFK